MAVTSLATGHLTRGTAMTGTVNPFGAWHNLRFCYVERNGGAISGRGVRWPVAESSGRLYRSVRGPTVESVAASC